MSELQGRAAVVTGGSRGIGRALVLALVRAGAKVVFCTRRDSEEASEVVRVGQALGGVLAHVVADVASEVQVDRLFDHALDLHGRVDIALHNAGISHSALLVSLEEARLDAMLATNTTSAFLVARRVARDVARFSRPATLITIGSLAQHGSPANAAYAASKGALVGLTRAIAAECGASGLRAYLAVVGLVETDLTRDLPERTRSLLLDTCPLKRASTPDEIAAAVVGLAVTEGALQNGEPFYLSGGLTEIPA